MATITLNVTISKTVATLDASTIAAIIQWLETNIRQKLPADASMTVTITIIP